jgi:PAS domain S-box-containing protein
MSARLNPALPGWIRHFPLISGLGVTLIGAAVLVGWFDDIAWIKSLSPRFVSMKANAALAFILLGTALFLASFENVAGARAIRWALELAVALIGATTFLQYVLGADFAIDQLLVDAPLRELQTSAPGRMSVVSALCFVLCAAALIAERASTPRGRATTRTLATCVGILGLLSLLGYLYGAPVLYRPFAESSAMSFLGAAAFILVAGGIVALHPQYGLPSIITGPTLVGTHVRWLFPAAVLIPLLIGGIAVQTYETFGAARVSIAITAAGTTIAIGFAIGLAALWLRGMEDSLEVINRALAATRQGVFIAEGTEPGRPIVYVNDAFSQLSGYSAREAIGRNCDFLTAGNTDDAEARTLREWLDAGTNCTVVLPSKRKDGTVFSGRFSISGVPGSDGTHHLVGLLEDVTAAQLADKARLDLLADTSQARRDAETASRGKDVFFASVTHELRSPLNACLMWLDVLALGPLSEKSAKGVDAIRRNLKIQTRLVNDLIDAAKISSGGIEIHPEPVDVGKMIEKNLDTWQLLAAAREVRFSHLADDGEHVLNVDPERLLQVLNNLLENAFRYSSAGGNVELRLRATAGGVEIDVADTGAGLSAEELQRVFTPFWRGQPTNTEHKGLGLGLAIAENLIKGHRGVLSVTSAGLGKGCTFRIRLPYPATEVYRTEAGVGAAAAASAGASPLRGYPGATGMG